MGAAVLVYGCQSGVMRSIPLFLSELVLCSLKNFFSGQITDTSGQTETQTDWQRRTNSDSNGQTDRQATKLAEADRHIQTDRERDRQRQAVSTCSRT